MEREEHALFDDFLERWHKVVNSRDMAGLDALLSPGARLSSPAFWAPKADRDYVRTVLTAVLTGVEDFHYTGEWMGGGRILLEFEGHIGETKLKGIDIISLDDDGNLDHIEVLVRPMNGLMAIAELVKAALAARAA
ncbi:nuclear transport factor 2 family protein [Zavarzinia aquatilis]|uniref:Nuclear transport factor 2 family protein n=1 Tax=Zavarzinia aquatilis TaxID=2211142 RepID=A0A317E3P4_9PROT|nr:nuclear transport factor 2 family protein [Zavarzinia aquatilis]PWR21212.1 nuclear transport factor 2 family protein [Zavarzinia aquatilis]